MNVSVSGSPPAAPVSLQSENSPSSNVFKNALNKFSKKSVEKSKTSNNLSAASVFFGRSKKHANTSNSNSQHQSSLSMTYSTSTTYPIPGQIKQIALCSQVPPVWVSPPLMPKSNSTSPSKDNTINGNTSTSNTQSGNNIGSTSGFRNHRVEQFHTLLSNDIVDLDKLREQSWGGIPYESRPLAWRLLLNYVPAQKDRREGILVRKRQEYVDLLQQYYYIPETDRSSKEQQTLHQILIDIPRTNADIPLFQCTQIQKPMERVLYIWAIRHPASGYVQGINDLLTPFLIVFLSNCVENPQTCDAQLLTAEQIANMEADSYWCLTKLLDDIQDHYTFSQPGLQRMVQRMEDLVKRIDHQLYSHIVDSEQVQFVQFAFRWMNCLLMREVPLNGIIRLWDTYLCEENGFENFHIYVCASTLLTFGDQLKQLGFQELVLFLQNLPTKDWTDHEIDPLLSRAYILQTYFADSPNHIPNRDS